MVRRRHWRIATGVAVLLLTGSRGLAQTATTFKGRLSSVPINAATAGSTLGAGTLVATLQGSVLTIKGTFEGLNSPATSAHVHRERPGLRGPDIFALTVTKAVTGTVEGTLTLSTRDKDALQRGWLYVQIQTERNPEGHLRGWLFK